MSAFCLEVVLVSGVDVMAPVSPQPADVSTCAYVVHSGDMLVNNPFSLSTADALTIFYAAVPVLAIAWGFRVVIQVLKQREEFHE